MLIRGQNRERKQEDSGAPPIEDVDLDLEPEPQQVELVFQIKPASSRLGRWEGRLMVRRDDETLVGWKRRHEITYDVIGPHIVHARSRERLLEKIRKEHALEIEDLKGLPQRVEEVDALQAD